MEASARNGSVQPALGTPSAAGSHAQHDQQLLPCLSLGQEGSGHSPEKLPGLTRSRQPARRSGSRGLDGLWPPSTTLSLGHGSAGEPYGARSPGPRVTPPPPAPALAQFGSPPQAPAEVHQDVPQGLRRNPPSSEQASQALSPSSGRRSSWVQHSPSPGERVHEAGDLVHRGGAAGQGKWPRWLLGPLERQGDVSGTCSSTATATAAPAPAAASEQGPRRAEQEVSQQLGALQGNPGKGREEGIRGPAEGLPRKRKSPSEGKEPGGPLQEARSERLPSCAQRHKEAGDSQRRSAQVGVAEATLRDRSERGSLGGTSRSAILSSAGVPREARPGPKSGAQEPGVLFPPPARVRSSSTANVAAMLAAVLDAMPPSRSTTSSTSTGGSSPAVGLLAPSSMSPSEWAQSRSQSQTQLQLTPSLQSQSQSQWATQSLLQSRSQASLVSSMGSMEAGRGTASLPAPSASGSARQGGAQLNRQDPTPRPLGAGADGRLDRFGPHLLSSKHHAPPSPGYGPRAPPPISSTASRGAPSLPTAGGALHWGGFLRQLSRSGEHGSPQGPGDAKAVREEDSGHDQLARMASSEQMKGLDDKVVALWHTMHLASSRRAAPALPLAGMPSAEPSVGLLSPGPGHPLREQVGSSRLDAQQSASNQLLQSLYLSQHQHQRQHRQLLEQVEQGQLLARHQLWLSRAQAAAAAAAAAADASNATWLPGREPRAATGDTAAARTNSRNLSTFTAHAPTFALPTAGLSGPDHLRPSHRALSGGPVQASLREGASGSGVSSGNSHSLSSRGQGPEPAPLWLNSSSAGSGSPQDLWHAALLQRQLLGSSDSAWLLNAATALPQSSDMGGTLRSLSTGAAEGWRARLGHSATGLASPVLPGAAEPSHAPPSCSGPRPGGPDTSASLSKACETRGAGTGEVSDGEPRYAGAGARAGAGAGDMSGGETGAGAGERGAAVASLSNAVLDSPGLGFVVEVQSAEGAQVVDPGHDGYAWRKYGKKHIKDAEYPRTYYRCAVETCGAKKHMQRVAREGPPEPAPTFLCTYDGQHNHPVVYGQGAFSPGSSSSASRAAGPLSSQAQAHGSGEAAAPDSEWAKGGHGAATLVRPAQQGFQQRKARIIARSDWARALLLEKNQERWKEKRGGQEVEQAAGEGEHEAGGQRPASGEAAEGLADGARGSSSRAQEGLSVHLESAGTGGEQAQERGTEWEGGPILERVALRASGEKEGMPHRKAEGGEEAAFACESAQVPNSLMHQDSQGEPLPSVLHNPDKRQRQDDPSKGDDLPALERLPGPSADQSVADQPLEKTLAGRGLAHKSSAVASTVPAEVGGSTVETSIREEYPRIFGAVLMPHQPGN